MNGAAIIGFGTYVFVALIMILIGVFQYRSKDPVAFYSGEEPPKREELSDVNAWNKKHGLMWIIYGIIIIISYIVGIPIIDSILCVIPMCGGVMIPIGFMVWYHHKLIKVYMNKEK